METLTTPSKTNSDQSSKACDLQGLLRYDIIEYRNQKVNFLLDPMGNQVFAQWNNMIFDLGLNNIYYKEDMCRVIDNYLDTISTFSYDHRLKGAKLEYFHNGDFRDIRLLYKGRLIKVFLVVNKVNTDQLIKEAEKILLFSGLLEED